MFPGSRLLLPITSYPVTLVPKPGRKEGHAVGEPSLLGGIAVLRRSGSTRERLPPIAARGDGAGSKEDLVGRRARCRPPGSRRDGCHPRGSGGVAPVRRGPEPVAVGHDGGGAGDGRLAASCPRSEEPSPSARRRRSVEPSPNGCPVPSHGTASDSQLVEDRAAVCPGTGSRIFFCLFVCFSSLPSLVSVAPHASVSFSLASSVHTPRYRSRRDRSPHGRGGGSRRSLGGTPRPARGDGGMWRAGRGRGPWEDGARSVA